MDFIVTSEQMKAAEENAAQRGLSLRKLAENAAFACCANILELAGAARDKTFTVLCGKGNNGGDGLLIASLLKEAGGEVLCVYVAGPPSSELARSVYARFLHAFPITDFSESENSVKTALLNSTVIIDCVFGTGFRGSPDSKVSGLFKFINENCKSLKVSVDVPSGIDADSGSRAEHSFIPSITYILGAYKKGMLSHPARDFCGETVLLDIGLIDGDYKTSDARFTDPSVMFCRPKRLKNSHKGDYGRVLNIAGSERYIGAALLSTKSAVRAGAGLVVLASPKQVVFSVAPFSPEAVFIPVDTDKNGFMSDSAIKAFTGDLSKATAVCVGCGLGVTGETRKITEYVIKNANCPVILDADGINSIADNINVLKDNDKLIITPHPAEFGRMLGITVAEVQKKRIDCARAFARESGAVVALKGVNTVIAAPDGRVAVNPTGNAGLAKAGTGDVLTGVIASFAAQGVKLFEAAVLGVYIHGLAADKIAEETPMSGITAGDVADMVGSM